MHEADAATHASFFSGVGGLDLGLERAGWRTVSFSEIDPYATAVLRRHWPGVPQLGDIVALADAARRAAEDRGRRAGRHGAESLDDWQHATLWSGGFPCQDLSVAGKRRGLGLGHGGTASEDTRSGLAFAFLDLVGQHRPRAVLLENVPGLLSSHGGRDMAALVGSLVELGYGVSWRVYDARYFGVPQRRRRIFILGLRSGPDDPDGHLAAERAAEVLAVGTRCRWHPPTGIAKGEEPAAGAGGRVAPAVRSGGHGYPGIGRDNDEKRLVTGLDIAGGLTRRYGKGVNTTIDDGAVVIGQPSPEWQPGDEQSGRYPSVRGGRLIGPSPDPGGVRAPDGLAGRLDDRGGVAAFVKRKRAQSETDDESWGAGDVTPTINGFDVGDTRATTLVQSLDQKRGGPDDNEAQAGHIIVGPSGDDDPLLPLGLDSHRYRCCGNGVVAPVAEWIGWRLMEALA